MNRHIKERLRLDQKQKDLNFRRRTFKGILFDSIFEKEVAQYLTSCGICWERNEKRFPTFVDGSMHYYVPDFFIPEQDLFLEVKGIWFSTAKKRKTFKAVKDNKLNWIVIMFNEWRKSKRILKEKIMYYKDKQ